MMSLFPNLYSLSGKLIVTYVVKGRIEGKRKKFFLMSKSVFFIAIKIIMVATRRRKNSKHIRSINLKDLMMRKVLDISKGSIRKSSLEIKEKSKIRILLLLAIFVRVLTMLINVNKRINKTSNEFMPYRKLN